MRPLLGTIVFKFGGDTATSVVEEAICAKFTDDGRRAIALAITSTNMHIKV